jgi:hypothetical protein
MPGIVGIGETRLAPGADVSAAALAAEAILAALDDARVALEDVDGLVRFDREALWEYDLPGLMRLEALAYYGAVPDVPGSAAALVRLAAMAVSQRLARVVVAFHARSGPRPDAPSEVLAAACGHTEAGGLVPAALGGCAFVVTEGDRVGNAVCVLGTFQAAIPTAATHLEAWLGSRREGVVRAGARRLFAEAGVGPADVDVACVSAQPALIGLVLDDFGLVPSGDRPRVNPDAGGELAVDGVGAVLAAVRQLRGDAERQVKGARIALVAASPLEPTSAALLGV